MGLNGSRAEKVLEDISIACNKNTVPGDKSALNPGGIRLGTPAITTRGLMEADIEQVVEFIHMGLTLALEVKAASGPTLKEFKSTLAENPSFQEKLKLLRENVETFAQKFPMPGFEVF
ncbi:serine hydroxymethyltransferase, cytosolic-like [Limulus polyphemus]|uniref:Serine hydroxymethyltransferase, cytosolic-like n=1 Tax=Limulus polyphemus TaxID=6850 RepID=A0ABM1BBB9_LIMPO|nr:serine hydroxymethyltransferase, cytosolic-like [Limulus polyphemus]